MIRPIGTTFGFPRLLQGELQFKPRRISLFGSRFLPPFVYFYGGGGGTTPKTTELDGTISVERLEQTVKAHFPDADIAVIKKAFNFLTKKLLPQRAEDIHHLMGVAGLLAEWGLPPEVVAAGLVHNQEPVEIRKAIGPKIADLVCGAARLSIKNDPPLEYEEDIENLAKMIITREDFQNEKGQSSTFTPEDLFHLQLILFANNFNILRNPSQTEKVRERYGKFFPLRASQHAHYLARCGAQLERAAIELIDYAFKYLEPQTYQRIAEEMGIADPKYRAEMKRFLDELCDDLKDELEKKFGEKYQALAFKVEATNRIKTVARGEQKKRRGEKIEDVHAFRIIIDTNIKTDHKHKLDEAVRKFNAGKINREEHQKIEKEYWKIVEIVNEVQYYLSTYLCVLYEWKEMEYRDHLFTPKNNLYQSVHLRFKDEEGNLFQVQIRTRGMHIWAEEGPAGHWRHVEGKEKLPEGEIKLDATTVEKFMRLRKELAQKVYIFYEHKKDKYEIRPMPRGATVLDLAYVIARKVGNSFAQAVVNGKGVPRRYVLQTGDLITIRTNGEEPSRAWLEDATTPLARLEITIKTNPPHTHPARSAQGAQILLYKGLKTRDLLKDPDLNAIAQQTYGLANAAELVLAVGWWIVPALEVIAAVEKKSPYKVERTKATVAFDPRSRQDLSGTLQNLFEKESGYRVEEIQREDNFYKLVINGGNEEVRLGYILSVLLGIKTRDFSVSYKIISPPPPPHLRKIQITIPAEFKLTRSIGKEKSALELILEQFRIEGIRIYNATVKVDQKGRIALTADCHRAEPFRNLADLLLRGIPDKLRKEVAVELL